LRGNYYLRRSNLHADRVLAKGAFEKATEQDPSFAQAYARLAEMKLDVNGDCDGAKADAARVVALQPDLPEGHEALAYIYGTCSQDSDNAIREFLVAVHGAPGDAQIRAGLGFAQAQAGELEEGLENLRHAYEGDPRHSAIVEGYAYCLLEAGKFELAEPVIARAKELSPDDPEVVALIVSIPVFRDGNFDLARKAFQQLLSEGEHVELGSWWTGVLLRDMPAQALQYASTPHAQKYDSLDRAILNGVAHFSLGHRSEAKATFQLMLQELQAEAKALKSATPTVVPHLDFAFAYAGVGRGEEALKELKMTKRTWLEELPIRARIATLRGRNDEALATLEELLSRPSMFTVAFLRASPFYATLRHDPRFEQMLVKHEHDRRQ
jgi:tetratricopeptide (TPR) repeat protein